LYSILQFGLIAVILRFAASTIKSAPREVAYGPILTFIGSKDAAL